MISASSSNVAPRAVPEPAVVSRQSVGASGRETLADGVRVARDAGRTVVHVVPRMRDEELESERRAPTELARERLDGARA